MACKKEIESQGGVIKWLTLQYNQYFKGKGAGSSPTYIIMGKALFQNYSDNLVTIQKFTSTENVGLPEPSLMFKATLCFKSKKAGWSLTIVGPYGILEA